MRTFVRIIPVFASLLATSQLVAQAAQTGQAASPPPLFIATTAIGETRVTPDRALVQVTVDSRGQSAADAGAQNRA